VGILLTVFLIASILEMLTAFIVRVYEGYWTDEGPIGRFKLHMIACQQKLLNKYQRSSKIEAFTARLEELNIEQGQLLAKYEAADDEQKKKEVTDEKDKIEKQIAKIEEQVSLEEKSAQNDCYYSFAQDPNDLKPTRLGNVLAAAEEYSYQVYRIDAVIWWPRLAVLLPESFRIQIDTALTPMLTVLNLSTMFILLAIIGVLILLIIHQWFFWGITFFIGGLLLARACYLAAVNQSIMYGRLVRVAFDLYRHEILKKMHMQVPDNLIAERLLWDMLTNWHYFYALPWASEKNVPLSDNPLYYYDTRQSSVISGDQKEVVLILTGGSKLIVEKEAEGKD
jgi:hypothetical protein